MRELDIIDRKVILMKCITNLLTLLPLAYCGTNAYANLAEAFNPAVHGRQFEIPLFTGLSYAFGVIATIIIADGAHKLINAWERHSVVELNALRLKEYRERIASGRPSCLSDGP